MTALKILRKILNRMEVGLAVPSAPHGETFIGDFLPPEDSGPYPGVERYIIEKSAFIRRPVPGSPRLGRSLG